jgi:hypothetical protein
MASTFTALAGLASTMFFGVIAWLNSIDAWWDEHHIGIFAVFSLWLIVYALGRIEARVTELRDELRKVNWRLSGASQ